MDEDEDEAGNCKLLKYFLSSAVTLLQEIVGDVDENVDLRNDTHQKHDAYEIVVID